MPHKDPERRKEYMRKYIAANREKRRAQYRLYYLKNLERERARSRAKIKVYRQKKKHDPEWQEKVRLSKKAYGKSAACLAYRKRTWAKISAIMSVSAEAYAKHRAKDRLYYAFKRVSQHKCYRPNMNARIPDWARKNQKILDLRSNFLPDNITHGQRAYAKELYRQRKSKC